MERRRVPTAGDCKCKSVEERRRTNDGSGVIRRSTMKAAHQKGPNSMQRNRSSCRRRKQVMPLWASSATRSEGTQNATFAAARAAVVREVLNCQPSVLEIENLPVRGHAWGCPRRRERRR